MNFFSITDDEGQILPYARHLVDAAALLGGTSADVRQTSLVLKDEYTSWIETNSKTYSPSQVVTALVNAMAKRTQAVYVTGLVGLALYARSKAGEKPSLTQALENVSGYVGEEYKIDFEFWNLKSRKIETKAKSVPTDPDAIRRAFNTHKRTLHICSARVVSSSYLEPLPPFDFAPEADCAYLATVAAFQQEFSKFDQVVRDPRSKSLELCHMAWIKGFSLDAEPLQPDPEFLVRLMSSKPNLYT